MNIVFMGTPDFAVPSLDILIENQYQIVAVVTAPDKPAGRGMKLQVPAIKEFALAKNIPVLQPEKLKSPEFIDKLKTLNPDLIVVVAFRMLPEEVWKMPPLGTFNLHGSLLPQYRGAAPINWALINGEKESGVTTFYIDKEIDTGNIIFSDAVAIDEETTAGELHDILMVKGAQLVLKTVKAIENKAIRPVSQDETGTHQKPLKPAPKIHKEDCRVDWNKPNVEIHNLVRGLSPYPAAWSELVHINSGDSLLVKIYKTKVSAQDNLPKPGQIITDNHSFLKVACGNGCVEILELQAQGKKRMETGDFLRGFKNMGHYRFNKAKTE